jgi:hypothetical protein
MLFLKYYMPIRPLIAIMKSFYIGEHYECCTLNQSTPECFQSGYIKEKTDIRNKLKGQFQEVPSMEGGRLFSPVLRTDRFTTFYWRRGGETRPQRITELREFSKWQLSNERPIRTPRQPTRPIPFTGPQPEKTNKKNVGKTLQLA